MPWPTRPSAARVSDRVHRSWSGRAHRVGGRTPAEGSRWPCSRCSFQDDERRFGRWQCGDWRPARRAVRRGSAATYGPLFDSVIGDAESLPLIVPGLRRRCDGGTLPHETAPPSIARSLRAGASDPPVRRADPTDGNAKRAAASTFRRSVAAPLSAAGARGATALIGNPVDACLAPARLTEVR